MRRAAHFCPSFLLQGSGAVLNVGCVHHQNVNAHIILGSARVVSRVMWPCMYWKKIRKGTEHTLVSSEAPCAHSCSSFLELKFVVLCY